MASAKFSVGQKVIMRKPNLYKETFGVITEVEKAFKEVKADGSFERNGLVTREREISSIQIPYEFNGETLKVTYPDGSVSISKFYGFSYVIKTQKLDSVYPERLVESYAKYVGKMFK